MLRRCTSESCIVKASSGMRSVGIDLPVANILHNPRQEWNALKRGKIRVAQHEMSVDWQKFNLDDYIYTHCFTPDTLVLMADGTEKPISQIEIGDLVVTHTGECHSVTKVMRRYVSEELVVIKPDSLPETMCTSEHPLYVIKKEMADCKHNKGWKKCIYGFGKKCRERQCLGNGSSPEFVAASLVRTGDLTFTPSLKPVVKSQDLNCEHLRLLGFYIAEGRVDTDKRPTIQDSVRFSLHKNEMSTLALEISSLMKSCFGVNSYGKFSKKGEQGITISFRSNKAAQWFRKHCGVGSHQKCLSKDVMWAPPEWQAGMLHSWALGDGNFGKRDFNLRISTVNDRLASQADVLFDRIGGLALRHKMKNAGPPNDRQRVGCTIWHVESQNANLGAIKSRYPQKKYSRGPRTSGRYRHAACIVSKVKRVERKHYEGFVYNLSVDTDESYVANRCAVHNCTIVSSVETEPNGYYIKPPCDELVNSNGNAWTSPILLATFRSFIGAENFYEHCFPAGTRVLMADGTYRPIETLCAGDRVINRLGAISVVKNLQKRTSRQFVTLRSRGLLNRELTLTANHPIWTFYADSTCPVSGRPNNPPRRKEMSKQTWSGTVAGINGQPKRFGWVPKWINAEEFDPKRHVLTRPIAALEIECDDFSDEKAELVGWFLSEGSYLRTNKFHDGPSGVVFSMSFQEQSVAARVREALSKEFGHLLRCDASPRSYESPGRSLVTYLSNITVANFFLHWCGQYSHGKQMPEEALWLPLRQQAIILRSVISGDGTDKIPSRGFSIELKSWALIQQLMGIANRLGLDPTYKETGVLPRYSERISISQDNSDVFLDPSTGKKSRPGFKLSFTVRDSKKLLELTNSKSKQIANRKSMRRAAIFENDNDDKYLVYWAEKKTHIAASDIPVFNIEVEGDNSYVAEGVVVHNCQVPELSKGKILDAVIRPVVYTGKNGAKSKVLYVDILVATHRRHGDLISRIESGELNTLSMGCHLDGTSVVMVDGTTKPIEKILCGERVVTHTGGIATVESTRRRITEDGELRRLSIYGLPDVYVTKEHPYLVLKGYDVCCGCGKTLPIRKDRMGVPQGMPQWCSTSCRHSVSNSNKQYESALVLVEQKMDFVWVPAGELRENDYVLTPLGRPKQQRSRLDRHLCRLLGYYAAEGNLQRSETGEIRAVEFSCDLGEPSVDEIVEYAKFYLGGDDSRIYVQDRVRESQDGKTSSGTRIVVQSKELASWLYNMAGEHCDAKKFAPEIMLLDDESLLEIIGAYISGNGHVHSQKRNFTVSTTSKALGEQALTILHFLEIPASSYEADDSDRNRRTAWYVSTRKDWAARLLKYTWKQVQQRIPHEKTANFHGYTMRRVSQNALVNGCYFVNNIHVVNETNDHSFIANKVAVHNCVAHVLTCSKCGFESNDDAEQCDHIRNELMTYFTDKNGVRRIVAEICGRTYSDKSTGKLVGDPSSLQFIEASWVENPAFKGAIINYFVSEVASKKSKILQKQSLDSIWEDDLSKIRVADSMGMLSLRVARSEIKRLRFSEIASRVAIDVDFD